MSLDGYVTGPGADADHGLGDAEELHAWVADQEVNVKAGKITEYKVRLKLTFVLDDKK